MGLNVLQGGLAFFKQWISRLPQHSSSPRQNSGLPLYFLLAAMHIDFLFNVTTAPILTYGEMKTAICGISGRLLKNNY